MVNAPKPIGGASAIEPAGPKPSPVPNHIEDLEQKEKVCDPLQLVMERRGGALWNYYTAKENFTWKENRMVNGRMASIYDVSRGDLTYQIWARGNEFDIVYASPELQTFFDPSGPAFVDGPFEFEGCPAPVSESAFWPDEDVFIASNSILLPRGRRSI